jgi:hypothetical protein
LTTVKIVLILLTEAISMQCYGSKTIIGEAACPPVDFGNNLNVPGRCFCRYDRLAESVSSGRLAYFRRGGRCLNPRRLDFGESWPVPMIFLSEPGSGLIPLPGCSFLAVSLE